MPNPIILTDAYKLTHHQQYSDTLTKLYSYGEARSGKHYITISWFGRCIILHDYFMTPITSFAPIQVIR